MDDNAADDDDRSSPFLDEQIVEVTSHTFLSLQNSRLGQAFIQSFEDCNDDQGLEDFKNLVSKLETKSSFRPVYLWIRMSTEAYPRTRETEEVLVLRGLTPSTTQKGRSFKMMKQRFEKLDLDRTLKEFKSFESSRSNLESIRFDFKSSSVFREMRTLDLMQREGLELQELLRDPKVLEMIRAHSLEQPITE